MPSNDANEGSTLDLHWSDCQCRTCQHARAVGGRTVSPAASPASGDPSGNTTSGNVVKARSAVAALEGSPASERDRLNILNPIHISVKDTGDSYVVGTLGVWASGDTLAEAVDMLDEMIRHSRTKLEGMRDDQLGTHMREVRDALLKHVALVPPSPPAEPAKEPNEEPRG